MVANGARYRPILDASVECTETTTEQAGDGRGDRNPDTE